MENQPQNSGSQAENGGGNSNQRQPEKLIFDNPNYDSWYADTEKYQADESRYWRRQNKIGWFGLIINVVALAFAIVAAFTAWNAFIQTKRQADETELQRKLAELSFVAGQRAWVTVPKMKIVGQADRTKIKFSYVFENLGHSPTSGLYIDGRFIKSLKPGEESKRGEEINSYCRQGTEALLKDPEKWRATSIVPSEGYDWRQVNVSGGLIADMKDIPVLVGCVVYGQGLMVDKPAQIGFWAEVHYEENPPGIRGPFAHLPK